MDRFFKAAAGAFFTLVTGALWLLGGWDAALSVMFLMMGLDVASGLVTAGMRRSGKTAGGGFLSSALFLGLTRKFLMLLMVMLGHALDRLLGAAVCRVTVIGFYAANEAFSVVENAAVAGVPFPPGLLKLLERFRERRSGAGGDAGGE
ncbi:MAG TPA: phage holin family protein [Candidatus Limnocylindria bacterium]|nr:phage holin family protein [Candidatus Limnocylindria bacterium]